MLLRPLSVPLGARTAAAPNTRGVRGGHVHAVQLGVHVGPHRERVSARVESHAVNGGRASEVRLELREQNLFPVVALFHATLRRPTVGHSTNQTPDLSRQV